ncbi:ANTAR domain-containing protein [Streptomyces sp. NPDC056361]|uniref:ANTAR domain-containing protein n=1 Tax=Streptomyces sp. NPDC056361 TaxID=3345795 RepID=UPI0035E0CCC1
MGHGPLLSGPAAENRWLRARHARRRLLDLATGVLAAQMRLPPAEASEYPESLAGATGLSVEDIAADIVNAVAGDGGPFDTGLPRPAAASGSASPSIGVCVGERLAEHWWLRRAAAAAETAEIAGEAARTLLDDGLSSLGADSLWLWRHTGPGCLRLAGHAGVGAAEAVAWQWIPPAAPEPFRTVLADSAPVRLEEGPDDGVLLPGPAADAARALLPLSRRDRTVGVALVGRPGPATLDGAARRAVAGLLEVAGTVLDGDDPGLPPVPVPVLVDVLDSLAHPAALLCTRGAAGAASLEHLDDDVVTALGGAAPAYGSSLTRAFPVVHAELARLTRRALARHHARPAGRATARGTPRGGNPAAVLWRTAGSRFTPPL